MDAKNVTTGRRGVWGLVLIPAVVCLGLGAYIVQPLLFPTAPESEATSAATLADATAALRRKDYEQAGNLAREILLSDPSVAEAYLIAGEAALRLGDVETSLIYYQGVPLSAGPQYVTSLWSIGSVRLYQGKLREAEDYFRRTLKLDPAHVLANERLAFILGIEGRRWESVPYLFAPIRAGVISMEQLLLLATVDSRGAENDELIAASRRLNPNDWIPLIGVARVKFVEGKLAESEKLLREVLSHAPEQLSAQALLGRIIVDSGDAEKFEAWRKSLPNNAKDHPDIWFALGVWAQDHGDVAGAVRCFWETVRINPNHQRGCYRLARALKSEGKDAEAQPFLLRAETLEQLLQVIGPLYERREYRPSPAEMHKAAQITESLGRLWEAWAWYQLILVANPTDVEAGKEMSRLASQLKSQPPLVLAAANPALQLDLSGRSLPSWEALAEHSRRRAEAEGNTVRFEDLAAAAGIEFVYNNGDDPQVPGMLLCQELGGAVAVLDYDLDGWPDLYLAQGGPWPVQPEQTAFRDRLYRNLGNGQFQDVTERAGLGDNRFSQGAAVGDFDNDGWPDVFVANLGPCRLYHNRGDGTFAEITQPAGFQGEYWSTSCMFADLNGDTLADIYIVNYLTGRECLETECFEQGEKRACPPSNFPAEQDRLWLNQGDGRFVDVTAESGIVAPDGKELGALAADFQGTGQLSVYVSNDTTANFYFQNRAARRGDELQFEETAVLAGLAFDRDGIAQASMGIAAGDGDDDGLLDLFVTNFYQQSNTYYRQITPEFFEDVTQSTGLREPSIPYLSFGTQFLDFELDGRLDLALACGHVDDFRHIGQPYEMRQQLFSNRGNGQFAELAGEDVGPFFTGEYLGRSLALLDWDRDGKEDFGLLLLYRPMALLTNRTESAGHYLHLHLRGVQCERDAIGATVRATVGERTLVRQLTAGNGFQCSNQRSVHLGIGQAASLDQLIVKWPDGTEQVFENVPADREVMLVEGASSLFDVPRDLP